MDSLGLWLAQSQARSTVETGSQVQSSSCWAPAPLSIWPHWTHAIFLWNKSMCQTEQIFFYVKIILILRYCPSAKHKGICNFGCLSILGLQLQLLLRFAVRIPYWYQLFHYWKWIYSCLQWQIVSSLAQCLALRLWGNHKPLGRRLLISLAIYKGFSRG